MKTSKGFTLAELLTAISVHMIFIVMLGGTFYTLITFGSKSSQVLTARERGRRVIDYVDSRIRNAGLGMWDLGSSEAVRNSIDPLITGSKKPLKNLRIPVAVTYDYYDYGDGTFAKETLAAAATKTKKDITKKNGDEKILIGNILTLLYAEKEDDPDVNLMVQVTTEVNPGSSGSSGLSDEELDNKINEMIKDEDSEILGMKNWSESQVKQFLIDVYPSNASSLYKDFQDNRKKQWRGPLLAKWYGRYSVSWSLFLAIHPKPEWWQVFSWWRWIIDFWDNLRTLRKQILDWLIIYNEKHPDDPLTVDYGDVEGLEDIIPPSVETKYNFIAGEKVYGNSDFTSSSENINNWAVALGTGTPFTVNKKSNSEIELKLADDKTPEFRDIDELMYLRCERIFAENPYSTDGDKVKNLKISKLKDTDWGNVNPFETGILEIYMELNTGTRVLDFYVLSTGGKDRMTHNKPSEWPSTARWKDDYKHEVLYVSRASWKLNNLCEGFVWN